MVQFERMILDLEKMHKEKNELRNSLYYALQCNDLTKARLSYKMLNDLEEREIHIASDIEYIASLN
jgi:hypothetical protein